MTSDIATGITILITTRSPSSPPKSSTRCQCCLGDTGSLGARVRDEQEEQHYLPRNDTTLEGPLDDKPDTLPEETTDLGAATFMFSLMMLRERDCSAFDAMRDIVSASILLSMRVGTTGTLYSGGAPRTSNDHIMSSVCAWSKEGRQTETW
jgi:hypothetical protein